MGVRDVLRQIKFLTFMKRRLQMEWLKLHKKFEIDGDVCSTEYDGIPVKFLIKVNGELEPSGMLFYSQGGELNGYLGNIGLNGSEKVIFDVGAYHGHFSLYAAKKCPNAKVYAFEPDDVNRRILEENLRLNGIRNVVVVPLLLGDKDGKVLFDEKGLGTSQASQNGNSVKDVVTIDTFCKRNGIKQIDFLKADIEGSEVGLVKKSADFIIRNVKAAAIASYHEVDGMKSSDILERIFVERGVLVSSGYKPHWTTYIGRRCEYE